jgi:hypothetical protein
MNLSNKKKQSKPLKLIDDGYVVNYFRQSINFYHNPSGSIISESSKNQFIPNDELQRHSIIYNNQNRGEIVNNIDSFDFEAEITPPIAVQKKYRDIHDQKKTKISQQKGKCKVVNESEDEFQLNHFKPNRKMLEIQQNESMVKYRNYTKEKDRKIRKEKQYDAYQNQSSQQYDVNESENEIQLNHFKPNRKMLEIQQNESMVKYRNYTKEKDRKIRKEKQYDAYQNQSSQQYDVNESENEIQLNHFKPNRKMLEIQQNESMIDKKDTKHRNYTKEKYQNKSSQQYEHFGKAKKNPLQPILPNPTIDTTKHQTNNLQINAVIRNHKPAVIGNEPSLCERICRLICLPQKVQRTNTPIYQNPNTSPQKVQRTNTRTYQDRNTSRQKVQRINNPIYQNPNTSPQKVQRTNTRTYQDRNTSRQNLNISRLDATNIINTSRLDGTNHDISQYSYRQNDSSRPLGNHKSSFEIFGRQDPDKLVPQKAKNDIFRYF